MTDSVTCKTCGAPVADGARFCGGCGSAVTFCGGCAEQLAAGERFCPRCGTPAPGTALTSGGAASPWTQVLERLRTATSGEFQVIRELGRGGMAAVYLAQETALNRRVAIKVMAPGLMMGEGMVDRFRQEAVTIANLTHPNIITIHAVRQFEDLHYFVMKFVDGQALDGVLGHAGVLPVPIVRAILFQVGSGLAYAHRRGVIHRDIKPANILLDTDGNAIVTDFGIAKVAEVQGYTKTGTMVGTPAYMSPEQCVGEALTWSSDLYSLGIVAYELLTGAPPFAGSNYAIMQGHLEKTPPPIRDARPDCPDHLAAAVLRMIGKTPDDRFATMGEALRALEARPLAEDDPLRLQLERLVAPARAAGDDTPPPIPSPHVTPPRPATPAPPTVRTTPVPTVARIVIGGARDEVEAGDTLGLSAAVLGPAGEELPGRQVDWTSSAPSIASVTPTGAVLAHAPGTTTISATVAGVSASVPVAVRAPAVASLEVANARRSMISGEQVTLSAVPRDRRGRPVRQPVAWASSDPAIATISPSGQVLARAPGAVRLTASAAGVDTTLDMTVAPVVRVAIPPASPAVSVAETAVPAPAAPAPAAAPITPRRSAVGAAGPSPRRRRRAIPLAAAGAGLVVIVAALLLRGSHRAPDAPPATPDTLAAAPAARIVLSRTSLAIGAGDTGRIQARALDAAGGAIAGARPVWSSSDTGIARVDAGGIIVGVRTGVAAVSATLDGRTAIAAVTVRAARNDAARVASVDVSPIGTLTQGDTITARATPRDSTGRLTPAARVAWSSLEPAIASVDGSTGLVTAHAPGRATLVATADGKSRRVVLVVASATAPVSPPPAPAPAAAPPPDASAVAGATVRAAATDCFAAVRAGDATRVAALYQPVTDQDRRNQDKLLTLMRHKEWEFAVPTETISVTPQLTGDRAHGDFVVRLTWKTSFGHRRDESVTFRAEARPADGKWQAAGCRMQGSPDL